MEEVITIKPEISVIVPVYKVEPYLRRCVDSILAQTFTDFELILVDDGSPDNCGAICDAYTKQDKRVRVIHKENGGLSSARNAGMQIAIGNYFLFCDSDDYVAPQWIEHFIQFIKPEQDNYVFGGIVTDRTQGNKSFVDDSNALKVQKKFRCADYLRLQLNSQTGFAWNVLYYANVLRKHNIWFSSDIIVEDLPFNLQYVRYMKELTSTGAADYYYVQDERSTLSRKYYANGFRRWQEKYRATQSFIREVVSQKEQEEMRTLVADKYLFWFLQSLNNTFDKRNQQSIINKMRYNCTVVSSEEFQHCLQYAKASKEDKRYIALLKRKRYCLAYLLQLGAQVKRKMIRR